MFPVAHRLIAGLTAALVLLSSINCVCHGGILAPSESDCHHEVSTAAHSCCDHGDAHDDHDSAPCNHDGSSNHDAGCNHCRASLVSESASQQDFSKHFLSSFASPVLFVSNIYSLTFLHFDRRLSRSDLPPPVHPATLLSLGCLLTI